ncbi:N-glycosylase/DNA lyase [Thermovibrio guaymasensis]|uniref:N-glycosylase/DNA lyase n=1 Tax=Thermovibrio guaymasensis TaxID=240167 RepID=A0A420W5Q9_9BACT|nr:N-glycosylase/DNA lyase [Thermovibrio guaymasensis]RKQ60437.1 N-glycosylase/DNA lyase [Thermovibrio guaymasensis]
MKVKLKLHPDRGRTLAYHLREIYKKEGIFGHRELPDDAVREIIDGLKDEEILLLVTLTTALDYMRNADELWKSSIATFRDEEIKWVFNPNEVVRKGKEELSKALQKYRLAKKKVRDVEIWHSISKTLSEKYRGNLKELFAEYDYDVDKMFKDFQTNRKEEFPSISGIKLFPHWIRSLRDKLNIPFKNVEKLPIPVDVHVARATFTTGCITGKYTSKGINETVRKRVIELWEQALRGTGIAPIEMFRPLWLLSKYGCHYRKNDERPKLNQCPAKEFCIEGKVVVTSSRVEIDT